MQEKIDYVDEVIDLVDLDSCADAVIGTLGEGLNVEQRKRLTIGIELAARPELLLFLDEPTSGLDSQTSWSICDLMEKLTKNGQAILCTIHQPSASLFQRFDRLLLLAKGGRTVYFGEVGKNSSILIDYFQRNGAANFKPGQNPAEYMLDVIGATPSSKDTTTDWPAIWKSSPQYQEVQNELGRLSEQALTSASSSSGEPKDESEFAASLTTQIAEVTKRVFQQYWRTPSYIFSKAVLTAGSVSFIPSPLSQARLTIFFAYRHCSSACPTSTASRLSVAFLISLFAFSFFSSFSVKSLNKLCPCSSPSASYTRRERGLPRRIHGLPFSLPL